MKKAFLQLHIAVFLAGFTGILGRLITVNEGLLVWYRLMITAGTMWILYSITKKNQEDPREAALAHNRCGLHCSASLGYIFWFNKIC